MTTAPDAFNSPVETWTTIATVWASKDDIKDGERLRAQEVSAEITTRFRVRSSTVTRDITPKDRISFDGKTYDIFGIKEIDRLVGLEITAAARADG